ncbi:LysR family transcriptional regulator [Anaerostipes sp.]|uniref:LysR family transcriptional regulator n=1 Tax=Anaerostipes sp. TaxID=1872530 RepID=UPI0025C72E3E|nr:LysR family transcriptional regulator [Anaerostipes sp.]
MNIHELNYALCIAKHQNLTKAARELFISQPTLSKHLKKLERELGIKLFARIDNCYIPTYAGSRYLDYASRMLALQQDWEKELFELSSFNDGELHVAIPLMRSSCMVPYILPAFHKMHPKIRVHILEETYAIQECLLKDSSVDFAIFNETAPNPKLSYESLGKEPILLAVSPDHPLAADVSCETGNENMYPSVDWEAVKDEHFILHFPEQNTGAITARLLDKHHITPKVPFYTRNTQAALLLMMKNQGICFAPETYIRSMAFEKPPVCFSLEDEDAFTSTVLAYRKGAYLTSYAEDFIQLAKEYFQ